jgi:hypothetical protein
MSDFDDRPLVMGSVIGGRYFNVDRLGRLTSLNHPVPFTPGVNEARCRRELYSMVMAYGVWPGSGGAGTVELKVKSEEHRDDGHDVAKVGCSCGYYAFFHDEDTNQYQGAYGIIEGTGVCTVGSLGFRAAKARLLAVVRPKRRIVSVWDRVEHNYPDVAFFDRKKDARAEFPLSMPSIPTPETHEDFWTRGA